MFCLKFTNLKVFSRAGSCYFQLINAKQHATPIVLALVQLDCKLGQSSHSSYDKLFYKKKPGITTVKNYTFSSLIILTFSLFVSLVVTTTTRLLLNNLSAILVSSSLLANISSTFELLEDSVKSLYPVLEIIANELKRKENMLRK